MLGWMDVGQTCVELLIELVLVGWAQVEQIQVVAASSRAATGGGKEVRHVADAPAEQ